MGIWLWRREKWKISGAYVFFPLPTKIISLQFWEENKVDMNI